MKWNQSSLTWPSAAQQIQTSSESVTNQVATGMNNAIGRLTPLISDAEFQHHSLSIEAKKLLGLRTDLKSLLTQGQILTASPYQFQVGEIIQSGTYLTPYKSVEVITNKLRDQVDKNRPTGQLYCVAIMVCESQLSRFASTLTELTKVLPLPEWCHVARQSTALSTNEVDKFHQPVNIAQPRFKPQAALNANPLRDMLYLQGSQLATLESLANDKTNVIDKLKALANKRSAKLDNIKVNIEALKNMSGKVWSMSLIGNNESIATQLKQTALPNNSQYTIMSLMLSPQPLTFFENLFHGE